MTKDEILERYLNTVYLGNGAYGVQAGAETYFDRGVAELDIVQSAFLAGIIANPARFDPVRNPEDAKARRDIALRRLAAVDVVSPEAAEYMTAAPLPTTINQFNPETQDYFVEEVKQILFDDPRLGATREERQNRVFRGGLRIYTTLDPRAQALATGSRNDVLAELSPEGTPVGTTPNGLHPGPGPDRHPHQRHGRRRVRASRDTGAVRAMVGGAGFGTDQYNIATQGVGRSGGSTFKIFVLLALFENGYLPTDSVNGGGPCTFRDIPGMFPDPYTVENFGNSGGGGGTILSQTLRSSNCAYVRLGQIVGIDKVVQQARRMGITTPLQEAVSMPLGTKEVYPIDMAAAVASIAADGMFNAPYYIDRVEGPDGDVILAHEPDPRRAESVQSARLAAEVLERNVAERHRHPGPDPRSARRGEDRHRAGCQRRLVRRLHAVPGHGRLDRHTGRQVRGPHRRHRASPAARIRRRSGVGTCGPGTRACEELEYGEPEPITRSSRYLRLDRDVRLRWRGRLRGSSSSGGFTTTTTPRRWSTRPPRPRSPLRRPRRPRPRSARRRRCRDMPGWAGMSRWDALLSVQEHDTAVDQLVHRRAHLPSRAELDAAMGELRTLEAAVGGGRGPTPRARTGPAEAGGRDRVADRPRRPSTTRRCTAARSATPASSRRCRTRSGRSSGGSPSSRTRSSS